MARSLDEAQARVTSTARKMTAQGCASCVSMRRYCVGVRRDAGVLVVELFNQETIPARSVSNVNAHRIHDQEGGRVAGR